MWNTIKNAAQRVVNAVRGKVAPRAPAPKPPIRQNPMTTKAKPLPAKRYVYKQQALYAGKGSAQKNKAINAYNAQIRAQQEQADREYAIARAAEIKRQQAEAKQAQLDASKGSWQNKATSMADSIGKRAKAIAVKFGAKKDEKSMTAEQLAQAEANDKNASLLQKFKNFFTGGQTQRARDNIRTNLERDANRASRDAEIGQNQFNKDNEFYVNKLKQLEKDGNIAGYNSLFTEYDNWYNTSEKTFKNWTEKHFKNQKTQQDFYKKHTSDLGFINKVKKTSTAPLNFAFGALDVPRRIVNTGRNMIWSKREATYYDGSRKKLDIKSPRQAWNASRDQNVINTYKPKKFNRDDYAKRFPKKKWEATNNPNARWITGGKKVGKQSYDQYLKSQYKLENKRKIGESKARDLLADPLNFGGGITKKIVSKVPYAEGFIKGAKNVSNLKTAKSVKWLAQTKPGRAVKWLGSEVKSPKSVRRAEAIADIRQKSNQISNAYQLKLKKLADNAGKTSKINYKVFDDIKGLSDAEASILQRMNGGKLSRTDRLMLAGERNKPARAKLESIAKEWKRTSDLLAMSDKITAPKSRFFGKKKIYFADTRSFNKSGDMGSYNFYKKRKRGGIQSAQDLHTSQVDRLMASNYDLWAGKANKSNKALHEGDIKKLQSNYNKSKEKLWATLDKNTDLRMTKLDKVREGASKLSPMRLWKKSVLKYNPAWHVNNALWNTPASLAAGGKGTAKTYGKIFKGMVKERTFTPQILKDLPSEIVQQGIMGKGMASKIEGTARGASYKTLIDKGFTPKQAEKRVNDWLFDYTTKNYERPIKAVLPFYNWNKGLAKLALKMPFKYPRQAAKFGATNRYLASQQADLPNDQEVKDPITGETKTYSPKTNMKGKFRIPGTNHWRNLPFYPLDGDQVTVNPFLQGFNDFKSGKDIFGRDTTQSSIVGKISKFIPQADVASKQYKRLEAKFNPAKFKKNWIAETGTSKSGQGIDKSKTNYMKSLDPRDEANSSLASFFGIPRGTDFDPKLNKFKNNMYQFQKKFFATDWDAIDDYSERTKQQEAMAKSHGFDMPFVYKYWSRYDTDFSKAQKAQKDEARKIESEYWTKYHSLPKGVKGKSLSQRAKYSQDKLTELLRSGKLSENRFVLKGKLRQMISKLPEDKAIRAGKEARISAGKAKYARGMAKKADYDYAKRTGDWSRWRSKYGDTRSAKSKFWQSYWGEPDLAKRREMMRANPQYSKRTITQSDPKKVEEARFWSRYASVPKAEKAQLLRENPQYATRNDWTDEQWDIWKKQKREAQLAKLKARSGGNYDAFLKTNTGFANEYLTRRGRSRASVKVKWT